MVMLQFTELVSRFSANAQVLLILCLFLFAVYLLTLISFSRNAAERLQRLLYIWRRTDPTNTLFDMHHLTQKGTLPEDEK